jgi:purine-nucleoside phosphorylase
MSAGARVDEAVRHIQGRTPLAPAVAIIFGSGLAALARTLERSTRIAYATLPGFPPTSVPGHAGELVVGTLQGTAVAAFCGRFHLYEGLSAEEVALPVRVAAKLGARVLVVTNAAGSVNVQYKPGELMILVDHINLTGANPLAGPPDPRLGERFIDMTDAYDPELVGLAEKAGWKIGVAVRRGVYLGVAGPSYETPAEVKMARTLGADAVGMSTVLEVIAARQAGLRVLGLSCLTNMAAGVSKVKLDHAAVLQAAHTASAGITDLLGKIVAEVGPRSGARP